MKDRFRFRVWNEIRQEMICLEEQDSSPFNVDEYPQNFVMQCTGKRDKNNSLIYEGDIIYCKGKKRYNGEKLYSEVIFDNFFAAFMLSDENGIHSFPRNTDKIEIVGNIVHNKNLRG